MTEQMNGQMQMFDLDSWCGKTCREHSVATEEKILELSSKKPRKSQTKAPLFLDLRKGNGQLLAQSWQTGGALLGVYSMHSFGESPKEEEESHLWQILEGNALPKYCLSAKAAQGILNRAARRNKPLPDLLRKALEYMTRQYTTDTANSETYPKLSEQDTARGGGNAPIVVEPQIAGTIDSSYYKGTGERNGKERTVVAFEQIRQGQFGNGEKATTLSAHESKEGRDLVCCAADCRNGTESDINGTLQAKSSGGTSLNLNNVVRQKFIVRRLTPLECTRLQGYPDGWVDIGDWVDSKGKKHKDADSPKYKALGNSIAIPPWLFVLSRLNEYCEEKTMASLFDGIGGFPLIWELLNGTGSAVWCSEIEEFPIAVTKIRFPEGEEK